MGAFTMIVGVILMIVIHEGGHFVAAKAYGMKATEAFFGFGPKLWSMTRGETEYGIKAIPFGGYVRIIGMNPFEEVAPEDEGRTYRVASYGRKTVVVLAGIMSHFVVAIVLLWFVGVVWGPIVVAADGSQALTTTIGSVTDTVGTTGTPSPASIAGAQPGDVIVSTNGAPVATWDDFAEFAADRPGQDVVIGVERDGDVVELSATLATVERAVVDDNGKPVVDEAGDVVYEERGFFGVTAEAEREQIGPIAMIPRAISEFGEAVVRSIEGLWKMVIGFPELIASLFGGNDEILNDVRPISPIGLVQLAGPVESSLQLLAFVNIFVGVLNFVPLYPLDGGHFAVATYERLTGREPNVQRLVPVAAVVFLFLVSIGLVGVYLDIFKPIQ
jgi:membrane-associated protease RseP (regulator of RpoE activity)